MQIQKILDNSLTLLTDEANAGKTMALTSLIKGYLKKFKGTIYTYGMDKITHKLMRYAPKRLHTFHSLLEFENITNSIIIADEFPSLIDLKDRKKKKQVETSLRLIFHNNNKILLVGHPSDFNRFLCSKAGCFLFKSLNIPDMINGCRAKEIINQYGGDTKGAYRLNIPVGEMLCFDGVFWTEQCGYDKDLDTKADNVDLFVQKNRSVSCANTVLKKEINKLNMLK